MAIRYTVTTSSCPHCGRVIKQTSDFSFAWLLLMIFTAFMALFWVIGIAIIRAVFKNEILKMGSPLIDCPHCGRKINTGEKTEWADFDTLQKKSWSYKTLIRLCYALSGTILFCIIIPLFGAWTSKHESDVIIAIVLLVIAIISLGIIGFIFYKWKKYLESEIIVVSQSNYDDIKESWKRVHQIAPLLVDNDTYMISETKQIIKPTTNAQKTIVEEKPKLENLSIFEEFSDDTQEEVIAEKDKSTNSNKKHIITIKKNKVN